jgi:hypothetical protein
MTTAILSATVTLNLLQNATDSLNEALSKYQQGENGDPKAFKFAIGHLNHFIELIFKHHIQEIHPLLIYKNPFAHRIEKDKTIGFWEALNFINNESDCISQEFREDLKWIKGLRNSIEHHEFTMDTQKVKDTCGRVFKALKEFHESTSNLNLGDHVDLEHHETYKILSDEYEAKLAEALKRADDLEILADIPNDEFDAIARCTCSECGHDTFVIVDDSDTGYRCTFCNSEESEYMPVSCVCGVTDELGNMFSYLNEMTQEFEHRCYYCSGQHYADKDD